jgi:hypothetical protein
VRKRKKRVGYNYRLSVVEANEELLRSIEQAVIEGVPLVFDSEDLDELMRLRYKILEVLKCAEVFSEALEGRYSDLKSRVSVRLDAKARSLIVEARQSRAKLAAQGSSTSTTEFEVLNHLMEGKDLFYPIEFRLREETSSIEGIVAAAEIAGYEVEQQEQRGPRTWFVIFSKTREAPQPSAKKRSAFDAFDALDGG